MRRAQARFLLYNIKINYLRIYKHKKAYFFIKKQ